MDTKISSLCRQGQLEDFLSLLAALPNVNLDFVDENGCSPLIHAAYGGHLKIAAAILSFQRITLRAAGKTEQQTKCELKRLMQRKLYFNGCTAMHLASARGCEAMVKLLLNEDKTSVDVLNDHLATPLHYAVMNHRFQIANVLLMNGAIINKKDVRGNTPLDCAFGPYRSHFISLFRQYEVSNASPDIAIEQDIEQELGIDISKIVDDILSEDVSNELDGEALMHDLGDSSLRAARFMRPNPNMPYYLEQNEINDVRGNILKRRYLKARDDVLEKERALNQRHAEMAEKNWRCRKNLLRQNQVEAEKQRNGNGRRAPRLNRNLGADDVEKMPLGGRCKNKKRHQRKQRRRNRCRSDRTSSWNVTKAFEKLEM